MITAIAAIIAGATSRTARDRLAPALTFGRPDFVPVSRRRGEQACVRVLGDRHGRGMLLEVPADVGEDLLVVRVDELHGLA